jgi:hypothetical protein
MRTLSIPPVEQRYSRKNNRLCSIFPDSSQMPRSAIMLGREKRADRSASPPEAQSKQVLEKAGK